MFRLLVLMAVYLKIERFRDGGPYRIETSSLICSANQWTGLYMIGISITKELNKVKKQYDTFHVNSLLRNVPF